MITASFAASPILSKVTNMKFLGRLISTAAVAIVLTACSNEHGPREVQTRELPEFSTIDMEGAAALQISVGSPSSVQIEGDANVLDRIETEVREGTLYIRSRTKNWLPNRNGRHIAVRIHTPKLTLLRLGGGHTASIVGFAGGESQIEVKGAAKITASGELDELTVHLSGAGMANLGELKAANARVVVDGVGRVIVHTTQTLEATMNGMGAIHYLGSPREVRTHMNGLGSIGRQESAEIEPQQKPHPELDPEKLQPEYDEAAEWKQGGETEVI
jgi:hypothetical protein